MTERLSRWGVGPKIMAAGGAFAAVAGFVTWRWPEVFQISGVPSAVLLVGGVALVGVGFPLWVLGVRAAMSAYGRDRLVTSGVFALVRHPIYASWIVLIIPGLALLCRSWPLLGTSLAAYLAFKGSIGKEDEYLERRFGQAYRDYRLRVNEIIPLPRCRRR